MGIEYENSEQMMAWSRKRIGCKFRSDARAIGWTRDGELAAVVVYDGFSECDCNMHIASDGTRRWLTRGFLRAAFWHPFIQWDLRRVTGLVPTKNDAALAFDLNLGFQVEGRARKALADDDILILGMTRDECRFIPKEYRHA